MLVKTWRGTSVEQGNISSITQALEEAAFCVPCLLCIEADTASMEFHVWVNSIMSTWLGQRVLDVWLTIILGLSMRELKLTFESVDWGKQFTLPMWLLSPISQGPEQQKNVNVFCLPAFSSSCLWTQTEALALPVSQGCWHLDWNYTIALLSLQLANFRLWNLSASMIMLGEAHWLKPPTLARHHSNHRHELFYNRQSW